jgi:hypothetical protein
MKATVSSVISILILACCLNAAAGQQPQERKRAPELTSDDVAPSMKSPPPPQDSKLSKGSPGTGDPVTASWNEAIDRLDQVRSYRVRETGYWGHKAPVTQIDEEIAEPNYHVVMAHLELIVIRGISYERSKAPVTPWVQGKDDRKPWLVNTWYYKNVTGIKFVGTRSLDGIQVRVYDGFNNLKVRIRIFVADSDGLLRRIELTDSQDGHLVLVQNYYDYNNQDIVIQAP